MKIIKFALPLLLPFIMILSCEKEKNPFIGSWETSETTDYGSVVATVTFRSDMTMTFTMEVTVNAQTTSTSLDYTYTYTDTTITVKEEGGAEETTDYMISGKSLVVSLGGLGLQTFTKI